MEEEESGEAQLSFLTDSQAASSSALEKETERFRELLLYGRKKVSQPRTHGSPGGPWCARPCSREPCTLTATSRWRTRSVKSVWGPVCPLAAAELSSKGCQGQRPACAWPHPCCVYVSGTDPCAGRKSDCSHTVRHAFPVSSAGRVRGERHAAAHHQALQGTERACTGEAPQARADWWEGCTCALVAGVSRAWSSWYFDVVIRSESLYLVNSLHVDILQQQMGIVGSVRFAYHFSLPRHVHLLEEAVL